MSRGEGPGAKRRKLEPADDLLRLAHSIQLRLKAVEVVEAALASPEYVHCLPYPSLDPDVPERIVVANAAQPELRTFDYMGRERLTETMKVIDSLCGGGMFVGDVRRKKEHVEGAPQQLFAQMLMYGSPGWGKVSM